MNLLMVGGDTSLAQGRQDAFYQTLSRFAPYWDRIDIICPHAPGAEARTVHGNVYVHPSPWHKTRQLFFILKKARELLSQYHYDLIVSHDYGFFYNGFAVWRLSRQSGIPYVSEIHHVEGYPRAATPRQALYRALAMLYIRWVWPHAEAIRAVNRIEIPELLRRQGVPEDKILVLPSLYIDFDIFCPMPAEAKRYDALFVGRLSPNKGIFTLLNALSTVRTSRPDVRLCILGEGPLRPDIERHIDRMGLRANVTLLERVPSAYDVACLYNQSRMLVCASTSEGGPRVTAEAMACGIPVISTPVGMMRELIQNGENGLLFHWDANELAQKICLLLDDEPLRAHLAEAGRQSVQGFQADQVVAQYALGYQSLIRRLQERR